MGYKKKTEINGMRVYTFYEETPSRTNTKKGKIRKDIGKKVSDRDDLIADAFKLIFLTISALKEIYKVVPKDDIPKKTKELIDLSFEKYSNHENIMDLYLQSGDTEFIDRLLKRQDDIVKIIKENK